MSLNSSCAGVSVPVASTLSFGLIDRVGFAEGGFLLPRLDFPFLLLAAAAARARAALSSLALALSISAFAALAISRGEGLIDRSFVKSLARE